MFIHNLLKENTIARNYTDALIEDYIDKNPDSFENNYIMLSIAPSRLRYLAKDWNCPKNTENRRLLPETEWEKERAALLAYGSDLKINQRAELCGTYHKYGTSYLVWLEFTGADGINHKLDTFIRQSSSKGETYATKVIDGVECSTIYNTIVSNKNINPIIAKKLNSIGSVKWTGTTESKVQYKLNSWKQQTIFEAAADELDFVTLKQLDANDNHLYKGDPGQLADYDLTLQLANGSKITTRLDLKLLLDRLTLCDQAAHDAELLVASTLLTNEIVGERRSNFDCNIKIEETEEFKQLMLKFKQKLQEAGQCFIKINKINTESGSVDWEFYN